MLGGLEFSPSSALQPRKFKTSFPKPQAMDSRATMAERQMESRLVCSEDQGPQGAGGREDPFSGLRQQLIPLVLTEESGGWRMGAERSQVPPGENLLPCDFQAV